MHHLFAIQLAQKNIDAAETVLQRMRLEVEDYPATYTARADLSALKMNEPLKRSDPAWRDYFKLARGKYRDAIALDNTFIPAYIGLATVLLFPFHIVRNIPFEIKTSMRSNLTTVT